MQILWLSWKDISHEHAGGAELVQSQICKRLAADGHTVVVLTSRSGDNPAKEVIDGYTVHRQGHYRYTVYPLVFWRYWRQYRNWADVVIEEFNTAPFFARLYTKRPRIVLFHQLAREIWFYQFFQPLSSIGYALEPHIINAIKSKHILAMSPSTKRDLVRYGIKPDTISVISEGITLVPIKDLTAIAKSHHPSILAYGGIRPMKRTLDIVHAFEQAKVHIPALTLTIAGNDTGRYAEEVAQYVSNSRYADDITMTGRVPKKRLAALLSSHHFIIAAAVKEGWGLTITEAASQGTPAIAYDVDGQRDAVLYGKAGILCEPNPDDLAQAIIEAFSPTFNYKELQQQAWEYAKTINFDQTYHDFLKAIQQALLHKKAP